MPVLEKPFYVYFLIDPRDDSIFYVGKGKGKRIRRHVANVRNGKWDNGAKCERIVEIHAAGFNVIEHIHKDGLSEDQAFALERILIREHRENGLTNISSGTVTELQSCIAKLKHLRATMKSFQEWIFTTDMRRLKAAYQAYGDLGAYYDRFVAEIDAMIIDPLCDLNLITVESNGSRR